MTSECSRGPWVNVEKFAASLGSFARAAELSGSLDTFSAPELGGTFAESVSANELINARGASCADSQFSHAVRR